MAALHNDTTESSVTTESWVVFFVNDKGCWILGIHQHVFFSSIDTNGGGHFKENNSALGEMEFLSELRKFVSS